METERTRAIRRAQHDHLYDYIVKPAVRGDIRRRYGISSLAWIMLVLVLAVIAAVVRP